MVLMVSGRTDVVAFYTEWFINRYEAGYLDVRNPFNPLLVSRINFSNVDMIMFCTKNPLPIIPYLSKIDKPMLFHVTLTGYKEDIEPNVISKRKIIDGIKEISEIIGSENVVVRYDPVFLNPKYTLDYHVKAFDHLCELLGGYVEKIIISFLDNYKNVRKNSHFLNVIPFTNHDYLTIGKAFASSARKHGIAVQTCCEDIDLVEYGFVKDCCISKELALKMTGKNFPKWKSRDCNCVEVVDVGVYNSCQHFCKYCYANYDEKTVKFNFSQHDSSSSLLVGHLNNDDIIKERK